VIWTCWFQGREAAPPIVEHCLRSWERTNPSWQVRCMDSASIPRYLELQGVIDLDRQVLSARSLSDIVRIHLLHEFGGVWADATIFCSKPLDEWLPSAMSDRSSRSVTRDLRPTERVYLAERGAIALASSATKPRRSAGTGAERSRPTPPALLPCLDPAPVTRAGSSTLGRA